MQKPDSMLDSVRGFVSNLFGDREHELSLLTNPHNESASFSDNLTDEERVIYEQEPAVEEEIATIYPVYEQSQIVTRDLFDSIASAHQVDLSSVSEVLDNIVESISRTPDALLWLAKLKKSDGHAYNLALNVSITTMAFNSFLGFPKEQIKISGLAGLLQDIGKANLAADILLKKSKLTREEYQHAQKHVDESLSILRATPGIPPGVIKLVAEHHERVDGSGYPRQLQGSELTLISQTAGLIDTYCALTNDRSYALAAYHQQALEQIHALSGKQFTAELIDQLVQFMGIYPSIVRSRRRTPTTSRRSTSAFPGATC